MELKFNPDNSYKADASYHITSTFGEHILLQFQNLISSLPSPPGFPGAHAPLIGRNSLRNNNGAALKYIVGDRARARVCVYVYLHVCVCIYNSADHPPVRVKVYPLLATHTSRRRRRQRRRCQRPRRCIVGGQRLRGGATAHSSADRTSGRSTTSQHTKSARKRNRRVHGSRLGR